MPHAAQIQTLEVSGDVLEEEGPSTHPAHGAGGGELGAEAAGQHDVVQILAALRHAAVRQILDRVERLHRTSAFGDLAVSGGVAANRALRRELVAWGDERGVRVHLVPLVFSGDNAAMIAWAALLRVRRGEAGDPLATDARSRLEVPASQV